MHLNHCQKKRNPGTYTIARMGEGDTGLTNAICSSWLRNQIEFFISSKMGKQR